MTLPNKLKNMTLTVNGKAIKPIDASLEFTKALLLDGAAELCARSRDTLPRTTEEP